MRESLKLFAAVCTLFCYAPLFLTGCSTLFAPSMPSLRGYRAVPEAESKELVQAINSEASSIQSARAEYELKLSKGVGRQTLRQVLVFQRPHWLRIELFASSLNQLVLMAVSREGMLESLDARTNTLYRGFSTPQNLLKITQLPFSAEEMMLWFTGNILLSEKSVDSVDEAKFEVLKQPASRNKFPLYGIRGTLGSNRCVLLRFERESAKAPKLLSLELRTCDNDKLYFFSEFTYDAEVAPRQISFYLPGEGVKGNLTRQKFTPNPALPLDKLFTIRVSEQTVIRLLDEKTVLDPAKLP